MRIEKGVGIMKKIRNAAAFITVLFIIFTLIYGEWVKNIYKVDENLIGRISSTSENYTKIDKIPQNLKNAVVAVEDKRFYKHSGVDLISIGRAIVANVKEGRIKEGGSTITQQLAKNLFLSGERTFERKFKEMILALEIESKYSKEEILEMYLNVVYFGSGAHGVQNASKVYFDKNVWELSLGECAMLAGLPQAPSAYNPKKYYDKAKIRQEVVLNLMEENGFIKENKKLEAKKAVLE